MENQQLKNILQSPYDRTQWITYLQDIAENKNVLVVYLNPKQIDIGTPKARQLIQSFYEIGKLTTKDGAELPLYEVILNEKIRIEYNKVGVNNFIKEYIVKDAIKGALVTFAHSEKGKNEWRFSFISKNSASDFFAEAESRETNPKKYTYIFGTLEEHKTAMDRLEYLKNSKFEIEDFFEAFSVEPISKAFFDTYKEKHQILVDYLFENEKFDCIFKKQNETDIHKEKSVRSFVSRLMGRVIFLYFLQKKNWLGASNTDYQDGSANFLSQLFSENQDYQEDFYEKALCPLFFNALNTPKRENDEFALVNGKKVCIPFLNGGLFDEDQEPENHRTIQFEKFHFADLFQFFDEYNFTIYENSPDDHTVAVDPEMLGHIFENLIDYNKDTGTFYTPKEIVQYMTQQSLLHHLHIKLNISESSLENLIKNQSTSDFSEQDLQNIDTLLDNIKICDPAIGSGAFPMGILQEIFNLKALIFFELKKEWNPVQVKENIIQNAIYGVDLDEGAVEIARLRFWLSLVVDEKTPKALPNLDYKIMQGNSLVESYNGIDLSNLATTDEPLVTEQQSVLDFGEEYAKEITLFDSVSAENVQKLTNSYFTATNSDSVSKTTIKKQINELIEGKIHSKIYKEKKRVKHLIDAFYSKYNISYTDDLSTFNLKSKEVKEFLQRKLEYENYDKIEEELISFQYKTERPYFLWHTYFADVLNQGGFDIVIGNPPYIKEYDNRKAFDEFRNSEFYLGKMDIWYGFTSVGLNLLRQDGVLSFIAQNNWITSAGAKKLRKDILTRTKIEQFIDFGNYKVFDSAGIQTMIFILRKTNDNLEYPMKYSLLQNDKIDKKELKSFLDFNTKNEFESKKFIFNFKSEKFTNKTINFTNSEVDELLDKIENKGAFKLDDSEVAQGIVPNPDIVNSRNISLIPFEKIDKFNISIGDSVFVSNKGNFLKMEIEDIYIKPLYEPYLLEKYVDIDYDKEILYVTKQNYNNDAPKMLLHLEKYREIMDNRRENINNRLEYYHLHWARNSIFFEKGSKILSVRKCTAPIFIYTEKEAYTMMSINLIKTSRINQKWLTLLLNSKLIEFWLKHRGKMQGNNFQIDKEPILSIPIIVPNNEQYFIDLFNEICKLKQDNQDISQIENKSNILIYKLYDLSFDEVKIIDSTISIDAFQANQLPQ